MYRQSNFKWLVGQDTRDRKEIMRNSSEVFKSFPIPTISESMNPEKIMKEPGDKAKNVQDWGNDDFKAIVLRNMGRNNDGKHIQG